MATKAPTAIFPPPPPQYDRANEAAFRMDVQRYLQEVAAYPSTVAGTAAHASTHSAGGTDPITHANLAGLSTDDHTQYILANATRAFTAQPYWSTNPLVYGSGTIDKLPRWVAGTGLADSILSQSVGSSTVWGPDTFTGADATEVSGYNGWAGSTGYIRIYSNQAKQIWAGSGTVNQVYNGSAALASDFTMYMDVTTSTSHGTGQDLGFIARRPSGGPNAGIYVYIEPETGGSTVKLVLLRKNSGGTTIDSATTVTGIAWPALTQKRLKLVISGTTATASVEPAGGGATIASTSMTLTDTLTSQTYFSFYCVTAATSDFLWDNWSIDQATSNLTIGGTVVAGTWRGTAIEVAYGGTGLTSYAIGDILYASAATVLAKLVIGASGRWLGSSGTAPQWNAPAALTKTDDTNVTLTLGGSATTALLNAASLTLGWTGQLAVGRGGTGLSTFTAAGGMAYATAATTLAVLAIGTSGYFLKSTGSAPSWAQIAEADIADGAVFARLAADETITGAWTFSGNRVTVSASGGQEYRALDTAGGGVDVRLGANTFASGQGAVGTVGSHPFDLYTNSTRRLRVGATGSITSYTGLLMEGEDQAFVWDAGQRRVGLVKQTGYAPEIRYLSTANLTFRRVTTGTLESPSASDTPLSLGTDGSVSLNVYLLMNTDQWIRFGASAGLYCTTLHYFFNGGTSSAYWFMRSGDADDSALLFQNSGGNNVGRLYFDNLPTPTLRIYNGGGSEEWGTFTNTLTTLPALWIQNTAGQTFTAQSSNLGITLFQATGNADAFMTFHVGGDFAAYFGIGGVENDFCVGGWSMGANRYRVLHTGNMATQITAFAAATAGGNILPGSDGSYALGNGSYGWYNLYLRHATNPHIAIIKTNATARTWYLEATGNDLRFYDSSGTAGARFTMTSAGGNTHDVAAASTHVFKVNGTTVMTIDASGNLQARNVAYVWPASNASGSLTNDGAGNLSWSAGGGATTLDGLTDVTITSVATGHFLRYSGTQWVNEADIKLAATKRMYFDGGSDTYFVEASADQLELYVGGNLKMRVYGGTALELNVPTGNSIRFKINDTTVCSINPTTQGFHGKHIVDTTTMLYTVVTLTNGAGANTGTLTNAPAAGNPTKWIPIDDNGTTRYIPAW